MTMRWNVPHGRIQSVRIYVTDRVRSGMVFGPVAAGPTTEWGGVNIGKPGDTGYARIELRNGYLLHRSGPLQEAVDLEKVERTVIMRYNRSEQIHEIAGRFTNHRDGTFTLELQEGFFAEVEANPALFWSEVSWDEFFGRTPRTPPATTPNPSLFARLLALIY